jgi:sucrose-6-phosphate hydrolase SacC (GH32 family)
MHRNQARMAAIAVLVMASSQAGAQTYSEAYRPQFHFSPATNWMNDPNGLLYYDGTYNLFFQWNPTGTTWGDISWGHAVGPDLLHWAQLAPALVATPTQFFFSGSAVADVTNTSGFGSPGEPPLVAIYTSYYPSTMVLPNGQFILGGTQAQSIAYSLDQGLTWTQYAGNPVIPLPPTPYEGQYANFRDPKVFWYGPDSKWVMVASLATLHKVLLFSSPDLKNWSLMSEFGPANAVGGNWECPDLFELPVDGNPANKKWVLMLGVNPGSLPGGSGTQYFIGNFDGTTFTANDVIDTNQPPGSIVIANFEAATYADIGWTATGGLAGSGPTFGAVEGQSPVTGYKGRQLIDSFIGGDATQGTLTSPPFKITKPYLNFLYGGGYHPYNPATYGTAADTETAADLLVAGQVVDTTTGSNSEHLGWRSWNVSAYLGKMAQIKVVDANSSGWGHIDADQFVLSDVPKAEANWVDYGPDFYAASSWNGLPSNLLIAIGWMNNWNYGGNIPTAPPQGTGPWRSAMSIPRQFSLQTVNGQVRLVQQPVADFKNLLGPPFTVPTGKQVIVPGTSIDAVGKARGETLDISAVFENVNAKRFGLKVRMGPNGGDETLIGYDALMQDVFVDRWRSGDISFDPTFPGHYVAPLQPDASGHITLHVLVDWSSVEVFAQGTGQVVLTAQIFPAPTDRGVAAFAQGGDAILDSVSVRPVRSIWKHQ